MRIIGDTSVQDGASHSQRNAAAPKCGWTATTGFGKPHARLTWLALALAATVATSSAHAVSSIASVHCTAKVNGGPGVGVNDDVSGLGYVSAKSAKVADFLGNEYYVGGLSGYFCSATSSNGAVHLVAQADGLTKPGDPSLEGATKAQSEVGGVISDSFVPVVAGGAKVAGSIVTKIHVDGFVGGAGQYFLSTWQAALTLEPTINGVTGAVPKTTWQGSGLHQGGTGRPLTDHQNTGDFLVTVPLIFGQPVNWNLSAFITAYSSTGGPAPLDGPSLESAAYANFGNTFGWGGIVAAYDTIDQPLTLVSAISPTSGFDYLHAAAVPEPATWALLIAGLACGAAVVRRQGSCA